VGFLLISGSGIRVPAAQRKNPSRAGNSKRRSPGLLARATAEGFDRLGWRWWPTVSAIISRDYDGRLSCNNRGNFQFDCPCVSPAEVGFLAAS